MTKTESQAWRDARSGAVEALRKTGRTSIRVSDPMPTIQWACELVFGPRLESETAQEYFLRVARMSHQGAGQTSAIVQPRVINRMQSREMEAPKHPFERHLREAEIDALPHQVSMGWDGKMGRGYASWGNGAW